MYQIVLYPKRLLSFLSSSLMSSNFKLSGTRYLDAALKEGCEKGAGMKRFFKVIGIGSVCICMFYYWQSIRAEFEKLYQRFCEEEQAEEWIDFEYWQNRNSDIYAWIRIPGTPIDYPIVQGEEDGYYLRRDIDKESNIYGMIYTEKINGKDFSSPNTVVYGHHMNDGCMFGSLDKYLNRDYFEEHNEITIFTPEEKRTYKVIAAYEHPAEHILTTYDFSTAEGTMAYLQQIPEFAAVTGGVIQDGLEIVPPLLTLSTCTKNDKQMRCLVQGILTECEEKNDEE